MRTSGKKGRTFTPLRGKRATKSLSNCGGNQIVSAQDKLRRVGECKLEFWRIARVQGAENAMEKGCTSPTSETAATIGCVWLIVIGLLAVIKGHC